jgi:hypothetical protein
MTRRRSTADRLIHDLGRALLGSAAPSRRSISSNPAQAIRTLSRYALGGTATASPGILGLIGQVLKALGISAPDVRSRTRRQPGRVLGQVADALQTASAPPGAPPRRPVAAPAPGGQPPPGWAGGGFSGRFPGSTLDFGAEPPLPGQQSPYGEEILTPQSSNVFSFSFIRVPGQRTGTLYVTYKQNRLNPGSLSSGHVRKGRGLSRRQLIGKSGSTVGGKTNERGPLYAYLHCPPGVFTAMKAANSKGKFIWDRLRIRGTIHGHQLNYVLVQGSVTIQEGMSGTYIPRRATASGFRTRAVRDIGSKTFQTSTIPARSFNNRSRRTR